MRQWGRDPSRTRTCTFSKPCCNGARLVVDWVIEPLRPRTTNWVVEPGTWFAASTPNFVTMLQSAHFSPPGASPSFNHSGSFFAFTPVALPPQPYIIVRGKHPRRCLTMEEAFTMRQTLPFGCFGCYQGPNSCCFLLRAIVFTRSKG